MSTEPEDEPKIIKCPLCAGAGEIDEHDRDARDARKGYMRRIVEESRQWRRNNLLQSERLTMISWGEQLADYSLRLEKATLMLDAYQSELVACKLELEAFREREMWRAAEQEQVPSAVTVVVTTPCRHDFLQLTLGQLCRKCELFRANDGTEMG